MIEPVSWRQGRKKTPRRSKKKEKRLRKNEQVVRELQDNMKHNNIHIIGIPEGEEEEQGIENLFKKIMMEDFPNLMREKVTQIQETQRVPIKRNPKRPTSRHMMIKMAKKKNTPKQTRQRENVKGSNGETGSNM